MRLIDADVLTAYLEGYYDMDYGGTLINPSEFVGIVDVQPTAYDPDNVIAEIKEKSRVMSTKDSSHKYYKAIGTRVCEEIIKRGGVECN